MGSSYNLVAVRGLGALGQEDHVVCSSGTCCMPEAVYDARAQAYQDALAASRWGNSTLIAGALAAGVVGFIVGVLVGRSQ